MFYKKQIIFFAQRNVPSPDGASINSVKRSQKLIWKLTFLPNDQIQIKPRS